MAINTQASNLLDQRKRGVSIISGLGNMKRRLILRLLIFIASIYLFLSTTHIIFIGLCGFVLGLFIQYCSWLGGASKAWPYLESVIDWEKVRNDAETSP